MSALNGAGAPPQARFESDLSVLHMRFLLLVEPARSLSICLAVVSDCNTDAAGVAALLNSHCIS